VISPVLFNSGNLSFESFWDLEAKFLFEGLRYEDRSSVFQPWTEDLNAPYGNSCLAIAVGDVAGKGCVAALLASLGVGILREHAVHQSSSPAEMLADLNGHLQLPGTNGRFIAMVFASYNPEKHELALANAGLPLSLLVREKRAVPIEVMGRPLGLFPETQYDLVSISLNPGDVVVFCSDGIHEQMNATDEEFGIERLISNLSEMRTCSTAEQVIGNIMQAVRDHAGEKAYADSSDDRTIVVLRVT